MPTQAVVRRALPEEFLPEKKHDIGKVIAQGGMGAIPYQILTLRLPVTGKDAWEVIG